MDIFEKRILGVDFGLRRLGVAVSDPFHLTAQTLPTILYKTNEELWEKLKALFREFPIELVVVGQPLNLDGSESEISLLVNKFKESLEAKFGVPCQLWDERLTTHSANAVLREMGVKASRKKARRDQIAAVLILQGYLDWLRSNSPK